jgi:hypothetical protein
MLSHNGIPKACPKLGDCESLQHGLLAALEGGEKRVWCVGLFGRQESKTRVLEMAL